MKILMVHDIGYEVGGAEILLHAEMTELAKRGHDVQLLAGTPTVAPGAFNQYAYETNLGSFFAKFKSYLRNEAAVVALQQAVQTFQPDVIHLHTVTNFSPAAVREAARLAPTIMTLHDYGLLYPRLRQTDLDRAQYCGVGEDACCWRHAGPRYGFDYLRTGQLLSASRQLAGVIVPSQFMAKLANHFQLPNVTVVANGVQLNQATPVSGQNVLFIGRLEPEKGVFELLRQWPDVIKQVPGARLTIAGTGTLAEALQAYTSQQNITTSVTFTNHVPADAVPKLYQAASVVAVPAIWAEPFGLIGPEAMSAGRPVVASNRGGISEWLQPGVNGLAADPTDGHSLADALVSILNQPEQLKELAAGAARTSQAFSLEQHVTQLVKTYDQIVAPTHNQPA